MNRKEIEEHNNRKLGIKHEETDLNNLIIRKILV